MDASGKIKVYYVIAMRKKYYLFQLLTAARFASPGKLMIKTLFRIPQMPLKIKIVNKL